MKKITVEIEDNKYDELVEFFKLEMGGDVTDEEIVKELFRIDGCCGDMLELNDDLKNIKIEDI